MMGRGNTGPVHPWFGQDIRDGTALAVENYALLRRLWREDVVDGEGEHNVVHWSEFTRGGHFAAAEAPDLLVNDIRRFFRRLAG